MTLRRDVESVVNRREFHRSVEQLLTPEDRDYLFYALKEYNTYKSVAKLMLALNSCLDTPAKLDLLPYIRELVPRHDRKRFDSLAPYSRMARAMLPPTARNAQAQETTTTSTRTSAVPAPSHEVVRIITLQRPSGTSLGFSIRGGREHDLGIYVSHVDSLSLAERSGLLPGDQLLNVNGVSFKQITHSSAALVLTSHDDFRMVVKSAGKIPGKQVGKNSFVWVDTKGKPVGEVNANPDTTEMVTENRAAGDRLLASPDRHKVVLHASKKKPLGFSIRGGSEYSLGIYISVVDNGSVAEECGLRVGDQVLDVNGHSFVNIIHAEAVTILRSYPTFIMTVKSLGRLPKLSSKLEAGSENESKDNERPVTLKVDAEGESGIPSRTSSFFKALTSPLSSRKKSAPKRGQAHYSSDATLYQGSTAAASTSGQQAGSPRRTSPNRRDGVKYASEFALYRAPETTVPHQQSRRQQGANVRRVRSFNESKTEGVHEGHHGQSAFDIGGGRSQQQRPRASSTGSNTMPRAKRSKSPVGVSPLVTSDARAPTSPVLTTPPPTSPTRETESGRRIHSVKSRSRDSHGPRHQTARSPERPQGNRPQSREVQSPERHQGHSQRSPTDPARAGGVMYSGRSTSPASKVTTPITKAEVLGRSPRFFEHGVGTQVMLSSATSQAMGILLDRARHLLDNTAVEELKEKIEQYEQTKQIGNLVQFLITTLDSPTKLQLLTEIRSILHPLDLPKFDELVSQREVAALHKRASREFKDEEGDSEGETWKMYDVEAMEDQNQDHNDEAADRYTMVLTEIQKHGGQGSLRNSRRKDASHTSRHPPHDLGAFGNSNTQHMVHKASSDEPSMIGLQTEESFLAWNEEYGDERWLRGTDRGYTPGQPSANNAVVVELPKSGPNIGLNIHGGVNTPMPEVRIRKVLEGGVAHNDGFLKPGFEIVEVDGIKVRGMTHEQAARTIANAFSSEHPTIEFIVIPQ